MLQWPDKGTRPRILKTGQQGRTSQLRKRDRRHRLASWHDLASALSEPRQCLQSAAFALGHSSHATAESTINQRISAL